MKQSLQLLIFVPKITPRVNYIFSLIFKDILCTDILLTQDRDQFIGYAGPKFTYGEQPLGEELFFYATRFLFEKEICEQELTVFDWEGSKVFFAVPNPSAFPFDPFAASFYMASRYEEYLPFKPDLYDRFTAEESLAYRKGFLQKPVINIWAQKIMERLKQHFPGIVFPDKKYAYLSTIDIDNAYAYLHKGVMRTAGATLRSFFKLDFNELLERFRVLAGLQKDPYDTYELQFSIQQCYGLKPIYFILAGDYGLNDKNIPVSNLRFQSLMKSIADHAEVGIHPSFGSNSDPGIVKKEVLRLSGVVKREITRSRQHFLKLSFPQTYRNLAASDITDDYSMGYASHTGFRAGLCSPFYFYDLDRESPTNLRIHPFAVMDASLKYYMKINPDDAFEYIRPLIDEVKAVKGTFISVWHNESLSENKIWKGWREVYEQMVGMAAGE